MNVSTPYWGSDEDFRVVTGAGVERMRVTSLASTAVASRVAGRVVMAVNGMFTDDGTDLTAIGGGGGQFQPVDSDLTAIAALGTTTFGRSLLTMADAGAVRILLGLGTASVTAASAYDVAGAASSAQAASQPLDPDLTAISALTTTTYGRALLALADATAGRTALGLGTAATTAATAYESAGAAAAVQSASQPLDSDLTAIAALATLTFGRSVLTVADAAALRATAGMAPVTAPTVLSESVVVTLITQVATLFNSTNAAVNALRAALMSQGLLS